jgi:proteasome assembly chaperone (PAC2) family protein
VVRIDDDGHRSLEWPSNDFFVVHTTAIAGPLEEHPRDLIVCGGVEPHLRWRSFCDHLLDIARTTRAEMVVTLGAMVGTNPHSRPFPVTGSAASPLLAARLGLSSPTYQGPTGVVGTLHDTLDRAGVPVISLRVSVPHYVPAPPNPKATRALLKRFEDVTGVRTGFPRLDRPASEWEQRVNDAANEDEEVSTYVRKLERSYDDAEPLPSGEDIASELEAFLREQRDGD